MNEVLADVPEHITVTFHQCRGNREGSWMAEGGYDPVADVLFNAINVDGYFLEYDTARAGTFVPLRLLPKGKVVVLGIMSSKTPELEIRRRSEATDRRGGEIRAARSACGQPAMRLLQLDRRQSAERSEQEAKLTRLVEVARARLAVSGA